MNNKNYKNKSSEIYLDVPDTLVIKTTKKKKPGKTKRLPFATVISLFIIRQNCAADIRTQQRPARIFVVTARPRSCLCRYWIQIIIILINIINVPKDSFSGIRTRAPSVTWARCNHSAERLLSSSLVSK